MELGVTVKVEDSFPTIYGSGTDVFANSNPPLIREAVQPLLFNANKLSGSTANIHALKLDSSGSAYFLSFEADVSHSQTKSTTPKQILLALANTFCLTQDQLAKICNSSRKSVNNWLNGELPNKTKMKRLLNLYMILREWQNLGLNVDKFSVANNVLGGDALLDLLSEHDLSLDKILLAGSRIAMGDNANTPILDDPFA